MRAVVLKMLAPYLAVLVFWRLFHHAWACILVYHLQILLWSRWNVLRAAMGWNARLFSLAGIGFAAAGPLAFVLWPHMARVAADAWLTAHGLAGPARWLMIPYFGIVHPLLEQAHWSPLRAHPRSGPLAHLAYAGYHVIVLWSLMPPPWVAAAIASLLLASVAWRQLERAAGGGLAIPVLTHMLADTGLVCAAVLRAG